MQTTSLPIDPVDRQHALTKAVGMEANILDKIRQLSIIDAKKRILHRSTLAWLITNGYIPQGSDYVMANGVPKALPSESSSGLSAALPGWAQPPSSHLRARARPGDGSENDSTEPTFLQVSTVGGADSELEGHGMTRT